MIERLKNFPFILLFVIYAGYLGFQYYEFQFSADGEFAAHVALVNKTKEEVAGLKKKLKEAKAFMKNLDEKKSELRAQVKKLFEYQGVLSESLDVPSLIKVIITETKRIQLKVLRIEPGKRVTKDYYIEQEFKLDVKGSYSQMVLLAQRISQLQRILRIEAFSFKPSTVNSGRLNDQLDGQLSVKAYQYTTSNEDVAAGPFK